MSLGSNNNTLSCNTATANGEDGIYLHSSSNNTLSCNTATANGNEGILGGGIYLLTSSNNNTLTGNNASEGDWYGIVVDSSSNNTLTGNDVSSNGWDGVYLRGGSSSNSITCNLVANNVQRGFHLVEGSSGNTISNNTIMSNGNYNAITGGWEWNFESGAVVAEHNYWGTDNSTVIAAGIMGTVDYDPFLTDPAPCVPTDLMPCASTCSVPCPNCPVPCYESPPAPPSITSFAPPSSVNDTVCNWRTFNVTVNQTVNVSWYLNYSLLPGTNESIREANYTLHAQYVGVHIVSAVAENANGTDMQTWVWNVTGAPLPVLCITPDPPSHDFGIVPPGKTRNWDFEITNSGDPGSTLNWNVTADKSWISVSPASGTNTTVTVTIDTKLPDGGVKTGTITVNSNGGMKIGTIHVNIEIETAPETGYATFATTGGYFDSVEAVAEKTLPEEGKPAGMTFPHGFFSFTIKNLTAGQSVTVSIVLPSDLPANAEYWKYGSTPDNPTDHWYEFMYDGQTGAEINGDLVTLHFVDGLRGDDNPIPDGKIVDQGGPGSSPIPVPEFNAVGLLALIGVLSMVLAVATLRKKK